jgi:hypothetical protein
VSASEEEESDRFGTSPVSVVWIGKAEGLVFLGLRAPDCGPFDFAKVLGGLVRFLPPLDPRRVRAEIAQCTVPNFVPTGIPDGLLACAMRKPVRSLA